MQHANTHHVDGKEETQTSDAVQPRQPDYEDNYDPHLHRLLHNPTNNFETLVHLLKSAVGTGILAMPQSFGRVGLVTAVVASLLMGVMVTHCLTILLGAQYAACKRRRVPLISFPDSVSTAINMGPEKMHWLARPSSLIVDIFLVVHQLGICCVYIVFIASNMKKLCDAYFILSEFTYMLIILGPLVAMNLIPSLKLLAPFSAVANVLILVGLAIVVYFMFALKPISSRPVVLFDSVMAFPLFFGTMLFALTTVGVVVALENNMKTPKSFVKPFGILNIGMSIVTLMYVSMGVLGYMYCKNECRDSITLDLPQGKIVNAVLVAFMVAIFISYVLQCFVPVKIVWRGYVLPRLVNAGVRERYVTLAQYFVRIVLTLITFTLAAAVPQLGLFISLFGALCLSVLGVCIPALMDSCVAYSASELSIWRMIKNTVLFLLGLFGLIVGTYTALLNIIRTFF